MKNLFISEKPSVAMEFAKALGVSGQKKDGYLEDDRNIITWCVGHLVTMSYPEAYDPALKKWELNQLPFLPEPDTYRYEVIENTKKQYGVVAKLLNRADVGCIYYAGDSAREGEYIQRLVRAMAGCNKYALEKRVWIDSQTDEEIRRGIHDARPLAEYDSLSDSAYARAIEDYGIGINFSRAITLRYGSEVASAAGETHVTIAVGRVMSCVLGMVVRREREIRSFNSQKYYVVKAQILDGIIVAHKPREDSIFYAPADLYEMKGFLKEDKAKKVTSKLDAYLSLQDAVFKTSRKNAPLLFNLAELQAECTKRYHISPEQTLNVAQSLYEKKLTTYPRTDARVLTTAICAVIDRNINGLSGIPEIAPYVAWIQRNGAANSISQTRYTDDSSVTDHYAIIPTGNLTGLHNLDRLEKDVYMLICRRFLSIFYPPAVSEKMYAVFTARGEIFTCTAERLISSGWMEVAGNAPDTKAAEAKMAQIRRLSKGAACPAEFSITAEMTQPPKRYTSGSMVLAMENAGRFIEDASLREQIKGNGIGTSATRAETIKKLINSGYVKVDKAQVLTPALLGEAVFEVVSLCAPKMLSPEITASWEKGLAQIVNGDVSKQQYLEKMYQYIRTSTVQIIKSDCSADFRKRMQNVYAYYKKTERKKALQCPICGRQLREWKGSYFCTGKEEGCNFILWNKWCGKVIPAQSMQQLLEGRTTREIKGFTSKNGKEFAAKLKLTEGRISMVTDRGRKKVQQ